MYGLQTLLYFLVVPLLLLSMSCHAALAEANKETYVPKFQRFDIRQKIDWIIMDFKKNFRGVRHQFHANL